MVLKRFDIQPTQFRVLDFLNWQRDGTLILNPPFQRRSVWKPAARSYFIDTIVRGLPVPLLFLRERLDLDSQRIRREVVDGQQRLRTLFSYMDEKSLPDFDVEKDRFEVVENHNADIAGKNFTQLDEDTQNYIYEYRFSVQILPRDVEDREVLQIFARMNSTGVKLNPQELRNAEFFGEFKTSMYELAYEQLERWIQWRIFSEDQISRMLEVELVSDLTINMIQGLSGKTQGLINSRYAEYDATFAGRKELERRFRQTMDSIDDVYGVNIPTGVFRRQMHFFTLFAYVYDRQFGLGSRLVKAKAKPLPKILTDRLTRADKRFGEERLPRRVLEAVSGAATDIGRRRTRLEFVRSICDGKSR